MIDILSIDNSTNAVESWTAEQINIMIKQSNINKLKISDGVYTFGELYKMIENDKKRKERDEKKR